MMNECRFSIAVAARGSPLSRAQAKEVQAELEGVWLSMIFVETMGDRDQQTSLRDLGKTDFFTREIDRLLIEGQVDAAIHSAKDLPEPLCEGLSIAALTEGVDPRDCVVLRNGESFFELPKGALIATSSVRREEAVRALRRDVRFCDLRGTIQERLKKLETKEVDGVVVAEAALVRLNLRRELNRIFLPGDVAENQGRLAIVVRADDLKTAALFRSLDSRGKKRGWRILHLGLNPDSFNAKGKVYHYPVIRTRPLFDNVRRLHQIWPLCTHVIVTSKETAPFLLPFENKTVIAIGKKTAEALHGTDPLIAPFAEQEGIIKLLETLDLEGAVICYPRSSLARDLLASYLQEKKITSFVLDVYETICQRPGEPPSLEEMDEIVFTSPSCAEGYRRIYGAKLPPNKKITVQGRVTASEKLFATAVCNQL